MPKRKEIEGAQASEPKKARQDIPLEDDEYDGPAKVWCQRWPQQLFCS